MSIVIGVDPDSEKHGVAVYDNNQLVSLLCDDLFGIADILRHYLDRNPVVHIENVNGVSASFMARDKKASQAVKLKMAQHIGRCKQAQLEVERVCNHLGVKVVHHKISKKWKKADKDQFKRLTGWTGRSNEDTRSAAWFGYLGINAKS